MGLGQKNSEVILTARGDLNGTKIESSWKIEHSGNTNSVKMKIRAEKKLDVIIGMKYFVFILILPLGLLINKLFGTMDSSHIIILSTLILIFLMGLNLRLVKYFILNDL